MPHKSKADEFGSKAKQRSKRDASKRNFELNGSYSAKHLRMRAEAAANRVPRDDAPQSKGKR